MFCTWDATPASVAVSEPMKVQQCAGLADEHISAAARIMNACEP